MANERTPQQIIGDDAFNQLTFEGYVVTRPAAPVEGLTRFRQNYHDEIVVDEDGGYVSFFQAEAIIAAERAAIPILKGTAFKSRDGWKDTTREGEICFVWNKMYPAPYAPGQYPRVGKEHWSASTENFTFEPATPDEAIALFSDLKADNAARAARAEYFETENSSLRHKLRNDDLETQLAAARKALEDVQGYVREERTKLITVDPDFFAKYEVLKKIGKFIREARAALEAKP